MTPDSAGVGADWSVVPFGDDALLVVLPGLDAVRLADDALRGARAEGRLTDVVDQVPAAASVLLRTTRGADAAALAHDVTAEVERALAAQDAHSGGDGAGAGARRSASDAGLTAPSLLVTLPVRYDGRDLDEVAALTGLARDEVVRRHAAAEYTVAFGGFMPGFAYLVGLDPALTIPRRDSPRERVPAGSVAIADHFSAVYPAATPGGWRLLGTCDVPLFDVDRDPPALLTPGTRVRFVPMTSPPRAGAAPPAAVREHGARDLGNDVRAARPDAAARHDPATPLSPSPSPDPATPLSPSPSPDPATPLSPSPSPDPATPLSPSPSPDPAPPPDLAARPRLAVLDPGTLTLVEDLGRAGWAHVGVGRAGAADPDALRLANRLVGNPEGAAALEVLLGGLRLRADAPTTVALAGAPGPADVDGHPVGHHAPIELAAGQVLHVGTAVRGLRVYVAVRGGVDATPVLGSRSADQLAGIGPAPLARGDVLPVGAPPADPPPVDVAPRPEWPDTPVLRVVPGPHADWFAGGAAALDRAAGWSVTPATNRVALRLDGPPLARTAERAHDELPPSGLVPGAVQVPLSGLPIVFGVDHPVTGGYPVLAVVRRADLRWLAQLRPGERVRLVTH